MESQGAGSGVNSSSDNSTAEIDLTHRVRKTPSRNRNHLHTNPLVSFQNILNRSLYSIDRSTFAYIIERAVLRDPEETIRLIQQIPDVNQRSDAWYLASKSLAKSSVADAFKLVELAIADFGGNLGDHLKGAVTSEAAVADLGATLEYLSTGNQKTDFFDLAMKAWMNHHSPDWRAQLNKLELPETLRERATIGALQWLRSAGGLSSALDLIAEIPDTPVRNRFLAETAVQLGKEQGIESGVSFLMGLKDPILQREALVRLAGDYDTPLETIVESADLLETPTQYRDFLASYWKRRLRKASLEDLIYEAKTEGIDGNSPLLYELGFTAASNDRDDAIGLMRSTNLWSAAVVDGISTALNSEN